MGYSERIQVGEVYYIIHLSVIRKDATITKLRHALNASSPTYNEVSLNQKIALDPKLQTRIFNIITRIRKFEYVLFSGITLMSRQIF